jgi:aldose 1-epimerase
MSNHTYFNLKGLARGNVMDHHLWVNSDYYFRNNEQFVPDGAMLSVENTPFDMREPHRIDYATDIPNEHFSMMKGFSVCWALRNWNNTLSKTADVWDPHYGRGVETWTTEPGLLIYTGRGLNEKMIGKKGIPLEKFGGMLLETIHFANSPNRSEFPSTVLHPGERYYSTTEFRFYTK